MCCSFGRETALSRRAPAERDFWWKNPFMKRACLLLHLEKPWKRRKFTNFTCEKLQKQIFKDGELVYELPDIKEIQTKVKRQLDTTVWPEEQRFENPHTHYVDLSMKLYETKRELLEKFS